MREPTITGIERLSRLRSRRRGLVGAWAVVVSVGLSIMNVLLTGSRKAAL
jgi:hypothetical protein